MTLWSLHTTVKDSLEIEYKVTLSALGVSVQFLSRDLTGQVGSERMPTPLGDLRFDTVEPSLQYLGITPDLKNTNLSRKT